MTYSLTSVHPESVLMPVLRRSAADSAASKFEKLQSGKKDKEKAEAEDEMERTKQR